MSEVIRTGETVEIVLHSGEADMLREALSDWVHSAAGWMAQGDDHVRDMWNILTPLMNDLHVNDRAAFGKVTEDWRPAYGYR